MFTLYLVFHLFLYLLPYNIAIYDTYLIEASILLKKNKNYVLEKT